MRTTLKILSRIDWRIWAVVSVAFICIIITVSVPFLGFAQDASTFSGAVYASWVANVVFFAVAGMVVTVVSLVKPEAESLDSRARILFRKQTGKHVDYIVSKMKEVFESYAERHSVRFVVKEYNPDERKLFVSASDEITLRSYLDDVDTEWRSIYELKEMTLPPQGGVSNRLVYIRVDGTPIVSSRAFKSDISEKVSTKIGAGRACRVSYQADHWFSADVESMSLEAVRYSQEISLEVENLIGEASIVITAMAMGKELQPISVEPGQSKQIVLLSGVEPGWVVYEFKIGVPGR